MSSFDLIPRDLATTNIETYPLPSIYSPSSLFKLEVNAESVPVVDFANYDYAHFSMDSGPAEITISLIETTIDITTVRISPRKLDIVANMNKTSLNFTIPHDAYLIIKINGYKELVILADPKDTLKPEESGDGIFNVVERYGADGTGENLTTNAFQDAVDDAAKYSSDGSKQGIVYVPPGVYTVGNIILKSNTALYLEAGAVLWFSGNPVDYIVHWFKSSQNRNITWWISTEFESSNIKVFGRGTFDGRGYFSTTKPDDIGNNLLVPIATTNFLVDGPIFRDSGSWSVTPIRSSNLQFLNIKFLNRLDIGEDDGMDVMESQGVTIQHAIGISLDDPFSTKTWRNDVDISRNWPKGEPQPLTDVLLDDLLTWTRCFGFKVGQGLFQPQSRIVFRNGVVYDAAIGIGINHKYGTANASEITFENIDIERISLTLENRSSWMAFFTQNGGGGGTGMVQDITVKNIKVYDQGKTPATLMGYSNDSLISDVYFENVVMPESEEPAKTLDEANILIRGFYKDVFFFVNTSSN